MSKFRRVVTGHATDGRSIVASDEQVAGTPVPGMPGVELTTLWGGDAAPRYPDDGALPPFSSWFAPVGGYRLIEFVIGPDRAASDANADAAPDSEAVERLFPGLLATMDPAVPGMHRSATCDLLYVIAGRVILELDDGSATPLAAGDVVVQSGTMHAWRNPYDVPCRILGVIVGAHLAPPAG